MNETETVFSAGREAGSGSTEAPSPESKTDTPTGDALTQAAAELRQETEQENRETGLSPDYLRDGKILGKFTNADELAKSYQNLETKLNERAPAVPESYDLFGTMKERGYEFPNEEEAQTYYGEMEGKLKEAGVTDSQIGALIDLHVQEIEGVREALLAELGPQPDPKEQYATLKQEWGEDTNGRLEQLEAFAKEQFSTDVLNYPLPQSAEGLKLLDTVMRAQRGQQPAQNQGEAPATMKVAEIETRMAELRNHPDYFAQGKGQHLHSEMERLVAERARLKGS